MSKYTTQYAYSLASLIERQKAFSSQAFGPYPRVEGVCDHIRRELVEVQDDHNKGFDMVDEWADVILLALDGAWRSGADSERICQVVLDKLIRNEGRQWPDWRNADPDKAIEHIAEPDETTPKAKKYLVGMDKGSYSDIVAVNGDDPYQAAKNYGLANMEILNKRGSFTVNVYDNETKEFIDNPIVELTRYGEVNSW